jgi:amino acid adenylation domain-containing protein
MLLSDLVPDAAERFPNRVAYQGGGDDLTYRELEALTRKAASFLQSCGLTPGCTVGVLLRKDVKTAVAVHAILRAGGIVVPMDPSAPLGQTRAIVEDCQPRFIITHDEFSKTVSELENDRTAFNAILGIGGGANRLSWEELPEHSGVLVDPRLRHDDPAYVVYTSGSTGEPKGIVHSHRSGFAYARRAVDTYQVTEKDVVSGFPPLHFDQSTFEMFAAPLAGSAVSLIHDRDRSFPARLTEIIEHDGISIWYSVPTALVRILEFGALDQRDLSSLRWVKFGGEVYPVSKLRELMQQLPGVRFSNVYGPAEINQCSFYHLSEPPEEQTEAIPLGEMWPDAIGLVRSVGGELRQAGEGELCVATPAMMSGYWGRDTETKSAMLAHDWSGSEHVFYRTGDVIRIDENGLLWFKGRIDHQVKARGFRIELEAVDAAMDLYPQIDECASCLLRKHDGTTGLSAAIIPTDRDTFQTSKFRTHLRSHLAPHAIPEQFVIVESIPRNSNGKINRTAVEKLMEQG